MRRTLVVLAVLAVFASACSSAEDADLLIGIRASTDPAVGDDRLLFAVHEIGGTRRGSPDEIVTLVASPLDAPDVEFEAEAVFTWVVPDAIGLYLAKVPFDRAGIWQIEIGRAHV